MKILFLGPPCQQIEDTLSAYCTTTFRTEAPIDISLIRDEMFEFGISYRYRYIIRQDVINFFNGNLINLHISYLPWNRGSDPNLWSFVDKTPTGVTIHKVDSGIDTGDILLQKLVNFDLERETLATSYDKLSREIVSLFCENAEKLLMNKIIAKKQEGGGSSHRTKDRERVSHLFKNKMWDTPLVELTNKKWKSV